jgi:hypothetical protein
MFEKNILLLLTISLFLIIEKSQTQTNFTCVKDGLFGFNSCTQFYQCVYTNTPNAYKVLQNCTSGTLFDRNLQKCIGANQVICTNGTLTINIISSILFKQNAANLQTLFGGFSQILQ